MGLKVLQGEVKGKSGGERLRFQQEVGMVSFPVFVGTLGKCGLGERVKYFPVWCFW